MKSDNSDTIKRHRGDVKRPALKKRFLELLVDDRVLGNVSVATRILGINRDTVYNWRAKDNKFAKEWDEQIIIANGELIDEAQNALLKGIKAGNPSLIIFTLKNRDPERWNKQYKRTEESDKTMTHKVSPGFASLIKRTRYGEQNKAEAIQWKS